MRGALSLALVLAATPAVSAEAPPPVDCASVAGWQQEGPVRTFDPDNLFDYMNGNAEGYLLYGFARMDGVTCRSGDERLVIDVSEMVDYEHAYGMLTATRDMRRPLERIGMGGQVTDRRAAFVKDRYYVEIAAQSAKDHEPTLKAFAAAIESRIPGRTAPPAPLAWFPEQGLARDSARFIPESVLGVRQLSSGYVARYDVGEAFVVTEASPEAASQLLAELEARWQPAKATEVPGAAQAFSARDRYLDGLLLFRKGSRVAGLAKLAEGVDGRALAAALAASLP